MRRLSQHRRCQHHHYSSVSSRTCLNMQLQRYEKCVLVSFVWGQTMYIYIYNIHSHLDSYSRSLSLWKSLAWRKLGIFIIKSDTKTNRQTDGPTGRRADRVEYKPQNLSATFLRLMMKMLPGRHGQPLLSLG